MKLEGYNPWNWKNVTNTRFSRVPPRLLQYLCLEVSISQMRRGSSDCDQVPRRTEFHEHKQLEASCKQKTLLTCKSTHKDNKYLSKSSYSFVGIYDQYFFIKTSIFYDYNKKCFLDIPNNFTVERSPVLLFSVGT